MNSETKPDLSDPWRRAAFVPKSLPGGDYPTLQSPLAARSPTQVILHRARASRQL